MIMTRLDFLIIGPMKTLHRLKFNGITPMTTDIIFKAVTYPFYSVPTWRMLNRLFCVLFLPSFRFSKSRKQLRHTLSAVATSCRIIIPVRHSRVYIEHRRRVPFEYPKRTNPTRHCNTCNRRSRITDARGLEHRHPTMYLKSRNLNRNVRRRSVNNRNNIDNGYL